MVYYRVHVLDDKVIASKNNLAVLKLESREFFKIPLAENVGNIRYSTETITSGTVLHRVYITQVINCQSIRRFMLNLYYTEW
jgi:hypothetical protein